jgi:alkanesulfonate monooxygenase SsuD/methylene tetrahydromethanopterin reductase-like flavin-dependent oxidoreductase (luciferase family)
MLLPFQHPVLVAEEITNVDVFSNGRFELGVGQGYALQEFETLCMERKERGARMREGIKIVERILSEDNVTVDGKYTQVKNATICPKPIQRPLPIWIGARGPRAIKFAADQGYHLMATLGPDPVPLYRETLAASGRDPANFKVAQLRMVYCAESADQAWEESQEHLFHILDFYQGVLSQAADVEGDDQILTVSKPEDLRSAPVAEHLLIGTPTQIAEKFEKFLQDFACTDFIMETQMPGIDPMKANRSFELFAKKVMPEFRDA